MRHLVICIAIMFVILVCDSSFHRDQEVTLAPSLSELEEAAEKRGMNPRSVDFERMYELGLYNVFISKPIALTGAQVDALKERWPEQSSRYFRDGYSMKTMYYDPPSDQDSCFGLDNPADPYFCECVIHPDRCHLRDRDPVEHEEGRTGSEDTDYSEEDTNDSSTEEESEPNCNLSQGAVSLVASSNFQSQVWDNVIYAGGRASTSVRISGFLDSCIYVGNAKIQSEVVLVTDSGERITLQTAEKGNMSRESGLIFIVDDYVEVEVGLQTPLQNTMKIERLTSHSGEYKFTTLGTWRELPAESILKIENF